MTVSDLINLLKTEDPSRIVVMSADGEGNNFSPLSGHSVGSYRADSTWSGEVGLEKLTPEMEKKGYSEEDVIEGKRALVLWPTN